ncbi:interleukin-20 receptor subunit beta [Polymixia lowei]
MRVRGGPCHCVLPLLLCISTSYASMSASPRGISMVSVNMRHMLRWRPLQAACNNTVLYSVQFQGEFELRILNGSWVDAPECQHTPHTHCDLTFDLGSDSNYNIHVRAECQTQVSPWATLGRPFNRRDTLLTVPEMMVTTEGDALQVSFQDLPFTARVNVTVWKRGQELQASTYTNPVEQTPVHIAALQEGAVYCVRAQTYLDTQHRSSSTDKHCVSISGPGPSWMKPTTVTVTVVGVAGFLFAVFWSVIHCNPDTCQVYFHKEPLPGSLQPDWQIQRLKFPEEAELCDPVQVVLLSDSCQP